MKNTGQTAEGANDATKLVLYTAKIFAGRVKAGGISDVKAMNQKHESAEELTQCGTITLFPMLLLLVR